MHSILPNSSSLHEENRFSDVRRCQLSVRHVLFGCDVFYRAMVCKLKLGKVSLPRSTQLLCSIPPCCTKNDQNMCYHFITMYNQSSPRLQYSTSALEGVVCRSLAIEGHCGAVVQPYWLQSIFTLRGPCGTDDWRFQVIL